MTCNCKITNPARGAYICTCTENLSAMGGCLRGGLCIVYMAEFEFRFIYKCIILCIDCFVVNANFVLLKKFVLLKPVVLLRKQSG